MIFREFNPEIHDVYKVAELIYDVDYRTFKHVFKSKEEGVEAIKNRLLLIDFAKDAEADENDLFYVFFKIWESDVTFRLHHSIVVIQNQTFVFQHDDSSFLI